LYFFFIKIPISYTFLLWLKTEYFLKPNIGSRALSRKKKKKGKTLKPDHTGNSERGRETSQVRENGGSKER